MVTHQSKRERAGACSTCRTRKKRCIPSSEGYGCRLCHSLSVRCTLVRDPGPAKVTRGLSPVKRPPRANNSSIGPLLSEETGNPALLATHEALLEMVQLYFSRIHNIAHTMFHEPSFLKLLDEGKASMKLAYAMCALSARYSVNPCFRDVPPCDRGKAYASEAMQLCHQCMDAPSLVMVQALLLIGYYFSGEGDLQRKHIYVGSARLHAEALILQRSPMQLDAVQQEEYRRTVLSVRIATHWGATDIAIEPEDASYAVAIYPKVDDVSFRSSYPERQLQHVGISPASQCNMWAQMAQTLDIFTKINGLLRRLSRGVISFAEYAHEVPVLEGRLNQWNESLPAILTFNIDQLMFFVDRRLGRTFLSMHIGYFHFRQMLLFPFLEAGTGQEAATVRRMTEKCNKSAAAISDILQYATSLQDCELDYFIYGHIAVVSSCVHLHSLLLSEDPLALSTARQRLILNFKFLMRIKLYWPIVESSVIRLRTFQSSCRTSMSDPFVFDNWMARFLTEHSSLLAERQLFVSNTGDIGAELQNMRHTDDSRGPQDATFNPGDEDTSVPTVPATAELKGLIAARDDLSSLVHDKNINNEDLANDVLEWLSRN
ncbi:hypothetical protein BDV25DRAFT_152054 [Aspergillus avenaceus]|uniref:Zn(2)-C6 fungal-type domain-containing protein n=1 Tax=Aspergillus avenaceus TaxID=36643 RepID=A0A5N6TZS9_ASPAV|nr:hypothetical protein BDV25DRAFT_152054 [Aspergillus avenaceus]